MIKESATSVVKAINKPLTSRISSPTTPTLAKRREIVENGDHKQQIGYAETCKTIKMSAKKDKRTHDK